MRLSVTIFFEYAQNDIYHSIVRREFRFFFNFAILKNNE